MARVDSCVKCGSDNIKTVEKELEYNLKNPGQVMVKQECAECQECHETYFDEQQSLELARKLDEAKKAE